MKPVDGEIDALSGRLQADLLAFNGTLPGPTRRFRLQLLIPLAVIAGAALLVALSPKARGSLLLKVALLASTRALQEADVRQAGFTGPGRIPRVP